MNPLNQKLTLLAFFVLVGCKASFDTKVTTVKKTVNEIDKEAPVAVPLTVPSFNEDMQALVTLNYVDPKNEHATSCEIKSISNASVSQGCACLGGVCTVGIKGLPDYNGAGSFSYTVLKGTHISKPVNASLNILAVNDAPVMNLALSSISLAYNGSGSVSASVSDVDNSLACSNIALSSNNTTLISSANLTIFGTAPNCSINIKAGLNQSGSAVVSAILSDSAGGSISKSISVTIAAAPVQVPAVALPAKIEAENFVRYSDTTPGSQFNTATSAGCRTGTDVDLEISGDAGGTCNVGFGVVGEYLEYDISSATAKNYDFIFRLATNASGKQVRVQLDGVDIAAAMNVIISDWQIYNDHKISNIPLSAGNHVLRFTYLSNDINFNYFSATAAVVVPVDNLAIANGVLTPATLVEDSFATIQLGYTDQDGDKATACSLSLSSNLVQSSQCTCDAAGICSVGLIGAANYTGNASFNYTVTTNAKVSSPGLGTLSISPVNDAPNLILANTSLSLAHNGSGSVGINPIDIDNAITCSSVRLSSSDIVKLPSANLSMSGSIPDCFINIKAGSAQSGQAIVTASLTDTAGLSISKTINVDIATAPVIEDPTPPAQNNGIFTGYEVHWIANTGAVESHIQNVIDDMYVTPEGAVYTKSFYDEGLTPNAIYVQGHKVGIDLTVGGPIANSRLAKVNLPTGEVTCEIKNFYGRFFFVPSTGAKINPPPTDSTAPFVDCSNGAIINSISDPTAIAFYNDGSLMVADNGSDQNVKFFDISGGRAAYLRSLGEVGGVMAGPIKGEVGPLRFWGIRGLGSDKLGNYYIGNTGFPAQTAGTDLRVIKKDGQTLLWQALGLSFVDGAGIDQKSDGSIIYTTSERFHVDYSKAPGESWSYKAVTLDPFRFPQDPRLNTASAVTYIRYIGGKKFAYLTDMYNQYAAIYDFEPNSEIMRPIGFIGVGSDMRYATFVGDNLPIQFKAGYVCPANSASWTTNDKKYCTHPATPPRWMWLDKNKNFKPDANEFEVFNMAFYTASRGMDVDDQGGITLGGQNITYIPSSGLDANGVPMYNVTAVKNFGKFSYSDLMPAMANFPADFDIESQEREGNNPTKIGARSQKYFPSTDTLMIATQIGMDGASMNMLYKYTNWSDASRRTLVTKFPLGYYSANGPTANPVHEYNAGGEPAVGVYPQTLEADSEYVYVAYLAKGPVKKLHGEIGIFDHNTGEKVASLAPSGDNTFNCGWIDLPSGAMHVATRNNGEKIITLEDDYTGQVIVYRWCPTNKVCGNNPIVQNPVPTSIAGEQVISGTLDSTFASSGKMLESATSSSGRKEGAVIKVLSDGKVIIGSTDSYDSNTRSIQITRYLSNGAVDSTFGSNGRYNKIDIAKKPFITNMDIDSSNRIVFIYSTHEYGNFHQSGVCRLSANGSLDVSFANQGCYVFSVSDPNRSGLAVPQGILIQSDGKILVSETSYGASKTMTLFRLTSSGALDNNATSGFGPHRLGYSIIPFGEAGEIKMIKRGSASQIAVAGKFGDNMAYFRFDTNGNIDKLVAVKNIAGHAKSLTQDQFGRVLLVGYEHQPQEIADSTQLLHMSAKSSAAVVRFNADDTIDRSFNTKGVLQGHVFVRTGGASQDVYGNRLNIGTNVHVLTGGEVFMTAHVENASGAGNLDTLIVKIKDNGILDTSFGQNGALLLSGTQVSNSAMDAQKKELFISGTEGNRQVVLKLK